MNPNPCAGPLPFRGWLCAAILALAATGALAAAPIDFNRDIRPILSDTCFNCHGPDEPARKAKLRLDTKEGALAQTKDGLWPIKPGDPAHSEIIRRITATDPDDVMPPLKSKLTLSREKIDLLRRWIAEGAKWESHWAFVPPRAVPVPSVKNASWPRQPIDHFIAARLEREGLKPSPEATKERLLRRVSFDLTGLPPTPAELDAFLADRAPDAYERVLDRLFDSPRYGERMATDWLDLAR